LLSCCSLSSGDNALVVVLLFVSKLIGGTLFLGSQFIHFCISLLVLFDLQISFDLASGIEAEL
jgi:hypothetical protein